jgi:translation elongation factor EF-Ts
VTEADRYGSIARCKILRQATGATLIDCRKALIECRDDMDRAIDWLRSRMRMA